MEEGNEGFAEAKDAASTAAEEAVPPLHTSKHCKTSEPSVNLLHQLAPAAQAAAANVLSDLLSEFKARVCMVSMVSLLNPVVADLFVVSQLEK